MTDTKPTIPSSDEAWENRTLGADEASVAVADESVEEAVDRAAGARLISIRMDQQMIDDLKFIASRRDGIGYQTLIKQVLARFIEREKKQLWREEVSKALKAERDEEARTNDRAA